MSSDDTEKVQKEFETIIRKKFGLDTPNYADFTFEGILDQYINEIMGDYVDMHKHLKSIEKSFKN